MIANALPRPLTAGSVDNAILRADGTGGSTLQSSGLLVEDAIVSFAVTGDAATDIITATGHNLVADQPVRFTALTGGSGLLTTTNYFVRDISGSTFKVSTTSGGAAVNFTTNITAGTLLTGHSVQVNVTLSENTSAADSSLVLTPKGTGALIAGPKPDGTATGGNARGANAVDLQPGGRNAATQVAAGANSVAIGYRASAFGSRGVAINGTAGNTIFGGDNSIAILGSAGVSSVAIGNGSSATGFNGVAIGENSTTSSGYVFGLSNNASGDRAIAIGSDNACSFYGATAIGRFNIAQSNYDAMCIGFRNNSSAAAAIAKGVYCVSNRTGMEAYAYGQFSALTTAQGDAQRARFVLRNKTTTNSAVELFLDGSSVRLTIPSGKIIALTINIAGVSSTGGAVAHYMRQYCLKNVAGTTTEVYAPITIGTDNAAGTSIALSASDASDALVVSVTGTASTIWRWVASVDAVEIAYGT